MRRLPAALLATLLALAACAVSAENTTVSLQAQAEREVANDLVVALVAAEESGPDAAALASVVNRRMGSATAATREFPSISARSAGYQTYPLYKNGRIEGWRASQQLRLESRDAAAMAKLLGKLQEFLLIKALNVGLSVEARRAAEDGLLEEAIAAFHARAGRVRQAMKAAGYRVRNIEVSASGSGGPRPLLMEQSMRATVAAPAIEAGASQVSVTVTGVVELQ